MLLLAQHFVDVHARAAPASAVTGISPAAAEKLLAYAWPGNVRELAELHRARRRAHAYEKIRSTTCPRRSASYRRSHVLVAGDDPSELVPLEEVERRYILRVLEAVGGNKTTAAQVLGRHRKTLYRKLEEYGSEEGARSA